MCFQRYQVTVVRESEFHNKKMRSYSEDHTHSRTLWIYQGKVNTGIREKIKLSSFFITV